MRTWRFNRIGSRVSKSRGKFKEIRAANLGNKDTAKEIVKYYKDAKRKFDPETDAAVAKKINQNSVPEFHLKERLIKYALRKDRLADPSGYNDLVLDALQAFSPKVDEGLLALMSTKSSAVRSFFFGPVSPGARLSDVQGAVTRIENVRDGKADLQILYSLNDSEPVPFLITLVAHELVHTLNIKEKIALLDKGSSLDEVQFYEEPRAVKNQLAAFIEGAKKNPTVFCNWVYPSWYAGEIIVPLSWTMAALERDAISGRLFVEYAKNYKLEGVLLNSSRTELNAQVKKRIQEIQKRYSNE